MSVVKWAVIGALLVTFCGGQLLHNRFRGLPLLSARKLKNRLQEKIGEYRLRNTKTICYEIVGCFDLPHRRSPLQKVPESPDFLQTRFYLFRRDLNFSEPEILKYDDNGQSLLESTFNYTQPLKMIIHGYMGKWNDFGNLIGAEAYIKTYDCNVILLDWTVGARGPQYATAAANTELVGRQLGMLLLKMVQNGLNPSNIHLIGFSLGAHVAGCSSELLKKKGYLIGRITGLDAASPLFRTNHLREKNKKLDREDAEFVDVVHTDSSPFVTDGFGLWEPVGHVDFFPNGGQEQPGCTDTRQSIVKTHFDGGLNRQVACSHIRAWRLFQETILPNPCQMTAFSCPGGLQSFERGHCFPVIKDNNRREIGQLGENVKGEGVMYLVTRGEAPYCGTQLQASVWISQKTGSVTGLINLDVQYLNYSASFKIKCHVVDYIITGTVMSGLATTDYNSLNGVNIINATLLITELEDDEENSTFSELVYIDKVAIRDMYGNSWQFCQSDTLLEDNFVELVLSKKHC